MGRAFANAAADHREAERFRGGLWLMKNAGAPVLFEGRRNVGRAA